MPAVRPSSSSKRPPPKQKGTVRAKSGCYTCRIRRKKCDEQPDSSGRCKTCIRLRLECLGFGAKRPDWLKESRNVTELRDKIKQFLANQGMIKGHSSTSSRAVEPEHPTLYLKANNNNSSDSCDSPPTPTLSLTDHTRPHHNVSHMRGDSYGMADYGPSSSNSLYQSSYRSHSPASSQGSAHDASLYQLSPVANVDTTLSMPATFPTFASSFSDLYNISILDEEFLPEFEQYNYPRNPEHFMPIDDMLKHYVEFVVGAQYLFADDGTRHNICEIVMSHGRTREGASLLASVHWQRFVNPAAFAFQSTETQGRLLQMQDILNNQDLSNGDAMAALHVVSSYLFDGGCGDWAQWLQLSCRYVDKLFKRYGSPSEALMRSHAKDVFIIKTTIWFDVLASVTTQTTPHFLKAIRDMFDPTQARIEERNSEDCSSMMSPMGCHNEVVWALAEASALYTWKKYHQQTESLSIPTLVSKAADIELFLQPRPHRQITADVDGCREMASEIFRASALLYLRTVVSGDHPSVPDIKDSVEDTIDCMRLLKCHPYDTDSGQAMSRSVVRNTVFSFFICGAFAEKKEHRNVVLDLLQESTGTGNCGSILNMLNDMWGQRDKARRAHSPQTVEWRNALAQAKMLLV